MVLRKLTKNDLPFLLEVRNHESTRYNLENDLVFDIKSCEKWFDKLTDSWYVIEVDGEYVGYMRVDGYYIGVDIHPDHRRKGFARSAFLKYLESRSYAKLWVFDDNFAKNLYTELGFKQTEKSKVVRDRLYVEMEYNKNPNRKVAKVLAFYFGDRRHYPHNKAGVLDLLELQVEAHRNHNPGIAMDLLIVNHDTEDEEVYKALEQYDNQKVATGVIRVIHRPRISRDLSFGSYKYAFHLLQNEYDYWFFSEDDLIPASDGLVVEMVDILDADEIVGFVGALNFDGIHEYYTTDGYITQTGGHSPHIHGGVGLTSTKKMQEVVKRVPGYLQTPNITNKVERYGDSLTTAEDYFQGSSHEIGFTYDFVRAGFKLKVKNSSHNMIHTRSQTKI